jgi:DNA-binding winged helix-turn-helix (wHTH) protein
VTKGASTPAAPSLALLAWRTSGARPAIHSEFTESSPSADRPAAGRHLRSEAAVESRSRPEDASFERVQQCVRFGDFELSLASETLWRKGARIRIQEQPLQLLVSLLERPGQIVTREELCRRLWPAATHGKRGRNLNTALRKVRLVLRDSPLHPRYVETVRGRGYRFLVSVENVEPPPLGAGRLQDAATRRRRGQWIGLGALALVVAAILMLLATGLCRADGGAMPTRETRGGRVEPAEASQPGRTTAPSRRVSFAVGCAQAVRRRPACSGRSR